MVEAFRALTIVLGGLVLVAAGSESARFLLRYHERHVKRDLWIGLQRFGTTLGVTFIIAELSGRIHRDSLSFRTPLAFCVFTVVLIAVVGILRDDT